MPAQVGLGDRHHHHMTGAWGDVLLATGTEVRLEGLGRLHPPDLDALGSEGAVTDELTEVAPSGALLCLPWAAATWAGSPGHADTIPSDPWPTVVTARGRPAASSGAVLDRGGALLATVPSATLVGAEGRRVVVEVQVSNGLPGFRVVGLPDASCREARDRARAAIISSGLRWPQRRVTVNLAPSALRKAGSVLDLAIAVGTLAADGQLPVDAVTGRAYIGELGLDGSLRRAPGALPLVACLERTEVVVPSACAAEAVLVRGPCVRPFHSLAELVAVLRGVRAWPLPPSPAASRPAPPGPDLAEVRGQALGRHALEVCAAGAHHLLMVGAAGAGKTMLATRLPGVLPELTEQAALEVAKVRSASGLDPGSEGLDRRPPFRAPHHSATTVALVGGGGARLRPGEASNAHHGVLFLDELAEFAPASLDALRQPLEEGRVVVSRASATVVFPARFILVAAMNGCRCGSDGAPGSCACPDRHRGGYARRVSGPLLDRFDMTVRIGRPAVADLLGGAGAPTPEPSATVAHRVLLARQASAARGVGANAELPAATLERWAPLSRAARQVLAARLASGRLTARGLVRCWRVALTVADLGGHVGELGAEHVLTALALRSDVLGPGAGAQGDGEP